jgi:hypothetical protein
MIPARDRRCWAPQSSATFQASLQSKIAGPKPADGGHTRPPTQKAFIKNQFSQSAGQLSR